MWYSQWKLNKYTIPPQTLLHFIKQTWLYSSSCIICVLTYVSNYKLTNVNLNMQYPQFNQTRSPIFIFLTCSRDCRVANWSRKGFSLVCIWSAPLVSSNSFLILISRYLYDMSSRLGQTRRGRSIRYSMMQF